MGAPAIVAITVAGFGVSNITCTLLKGLTSLKSVPFVPSMVIVGTMESTTNVAEPDAVCPTVSVPLTLTA